jgi:hypothetical protein
MNILQHLISKISHTADQHLLAAAEILARQHDPDAACAPLINVVLETLGGDAHLCEIVNLLLQAMVTQRGVDTRECMGFGARDPPRCPAMRTNRRVSSPCADADNDY